MMRNCQLIWSCLIAIGPPSFPLDSTPSFPLSAERSGEGLSSFLFLSEEVGEREKEAKEKIEEKTKEGKEH